MAVAGSVSGFLLFCSQNPDGRHRPAKSRFLFWGPLRPGDFAISGRESFVFFGSKKHQKLSDGGAIMPVLSIQKAAYIRGVRGHTCRFGQKKEVGHLPVSDLFWLG